MSNPPKSTTATGDSDQNQDSSVPVVVGDDSSEAASHTNSDFPRMHRFWKRTKQVADFVGPTAFIVGIVFAIMAWIDFDIGRRLGDETTLRKIAAQSRPSLTFNARESIIADMGAQQFVKDIRITKRSPEGWPERIMVDLTRHFANAPIMTPLYDQVFITSERGRLCSWEFEIHWGSLIPMTEGDKARLYRLEIVP